MRNTLITYTHGMKRELIDRMGRCRSLYALSLFAILSLSVTSLRAQPVLKDNPMLDKIDVIEHLGDKIDPKLTFTNSNGE